MTTIARPRNLGSRLLGIQAALVYAFFYLPILVLVIFSFSDDRLVGRWGGFTFGWYEAFWNDQELTDSLWVSLQVAASSTVISVVLGTLAAFSLERFRFRGQRVFDALLYLPIIIPDVTMGIMMLIFFMLIMIFTMQYSARRNIIISKIYFVVSKINVESTNIIFVIYDFRISIIDRLSFVTNFKFR